MSTLRVSNIEAKADASSPTIDEKVKVTNSDGDTLLVIDGKHSGITTVGINSTSTFAVDNHNNFNISGVVTATKFSGPFDGLTAGSINISGDATISGNLGVAGTVTYEDVDRVDATGISTFREGLNIGPLAGIALTAYKDGSIRTSGIITATTGSFSGTVTANSFSGDGSSLTGVGASFANSSVNSSGIGTFAGLDSTSGQIINKNIVINGNFQVNQRGTSANNGNGIYSTDRWGHYYGSTDVTTWTQRVQTTTPGPDAPAGEGHRQYFEVVKNVAGGTGAAGWSWFAYKIEAQDLACSGWDHKSATSYLTLSFWVRQSAASQLFYGALRTDDGTDYDYTFSYTADSTWRKISVTIPGNTNLTLNNDTGLGATLFFYQWLGTDSTTSGHTLNTWASAAGANRCPDMASGWINSTAWFRIAGVQLEVGPVATPFEHRPYQDHLLACQRYYQRCGLQMVWAGRGNGSATFVFGVPLAVPVRALPVVTMSGTMKVFEHDASSESTTAPTAGYGYELGAAAIALQQTGHSGLTDDRVINGYIHGGGSYLALAAEF